MNQSQNESVPSQKLQPLLNRLTIIEDDPDKKTKGGILIPTGIERSTATGVIVAMGGQVLEAVEGAQCVFNPDMATRIEVDGQDYVIIKESEIFAML